MSLEVGLNANEFDYLYSGFDARPKSNKAVIYRNNTLDVSNVDELTFMADGGGGIDIRDMRHHRNGGVTQRAVAPNQPRVSPRPIGGGVIPITPPSRPVVTIPPIGGGFTFPVFNLPNFPIFYPKTPILNPNPADSGTGTGTTGTGTGTTTTGTTTGTKADTAGSGGGASGGGASGGGGSDGSADASVQKTAGDATATSSNKLFWVLGAGVVLVLGYYYLKNNKHK